MIKFMKLYLIINCIFRCNAVSWRRQLEHIAESRLHSQGLASYRLPSRRFYQFDPRELSSILGVPSRASHLPEAEPILPGHTLLKPSFGMLKSAVKFPHKELEDGAGVYGNIDNLGIRYDSRNERNLYSGFRRSLSDYFMVIPINEKQTDSQRKPRFKLEAAVLDMERKENAKNKLLKILKTLNIPLKGLKAYVATFSEDHSDDLKTKQHSSYYQDEDAKTLNSYPPFNNFLRNTNDAQKRSEQSSSSKEQVISNANSKNKNKEELEKIKKIEWFLQSKNNFDHIKVNQNAPEFNELFPNGNDEKLREWWFYNSEDYKPFNQ